MSESIEEVLKQSYTKHTNRTLNIFWLGFAIYTASYALSTSTTVDYIICQFFQLIGIAMFVPSAIKLIEWKFTNEYLKTVFILYCFWQLTIIFRGFPLDYSSIKVLLFDAEMGLFRFFAPLILLFPKNLLYYNKMTKVVLFFGLLFLVYDVLFIDNLLNLDYENTSSKFTYEHFVKALSAACGIILLTFPYHSKRVKLFALLVLIVSVLFAVYRARRALIIISLAPIMMYYIMYLYTQKKKGLLLFVSFLFGIFVILLGVDSLSGKTPGIFRLLTERGAEDTRSGVEKSFYQDMEPIDWVVGKGISGTYYSPNIDIDSKTDYRDMIETDYLNIILKGGIISFALLLMIAIPALIKGFFHSKNILSKAAAVWILLWLLETYPATVSTFSMHYLLFWVAIGICNSNIVREIPEKELVKIFSN